MDWRTGILIATALGCSFPLYASDVFPPPGITLPEYWGEEHVWWHGRASFSGQVIASACVLAMEDSWQAVALGNTPVRELQHASTGPEKRFRLRLRECELEGTGSRVRVTFDGEQGETPDKFSTTGRARGVNLQILDSHGYIARAGQVMPPIELEGNEQELDYTLRLVRNGEPLRAGDYYATIRFKVDYE